MRNDIYNHTWCYLSGRVNILECYLLNQKFFERLVLSEKLDDVLINLNNTPLKSYFTQVKHLYEFETLLDDYYYSRLYEIRSLSPDSTICDLFLIKNDVLNLKKFIKAKILGTSIDKYFKGTIDKDRWDDVWQGKSTSLPEVFKESISFVKTVINTVQKERLPFVIDLIFDGAYLRHIAYIFNKMDVGIIRRYLKTYQLLKGFEIIRRTMVLRIETNLLNKYFLEGFGKEHIFRKLISNSEWTGEKTLSEAFVRAYCNTPLLEQYFIQMLSLNLFPKISFRYEVLSDNYLLDMLCPVKYIPFGSERVFGYLCGLTTEVFNLKLVLGGKVYGIGNNLLKERLRKTYV